MSADPKAAFSRLRAAMGTRLHFGAHARPPEPDAAREEALRAWDDPSPDRGGAAARAAARERAAGLLRWPDPALIAAASTAHELLARLLSCLPVGRDPRVLTTESEARDSARLLARLEEDGARVERVLVEPFGTFADRLLSAARSGAHDLILVSHVFDDTGLRVRDDLLAALAARAPLGAIVAVDGRHAMGFFPVDLSGAAERAFYLARAGPDAALLAAPPGCPLRPLDTGVLADPDGGVRAPAAPVGYAPMGARFQGGDFDPAPLRRWTAGLEQLSRARLGPREVDARVRALQEIFVRRLAERPRGPLDVSRLASLDLREVGHFLSLRHPEAARLSRFLVDDLGVLVDAVGDRLRFGFGPHLDEADVDELFRRLDGVGS